MSEETLEALSERIKQCKLCRDILDPNPVIRVSETARLMIIGQAPGIRVHKTGIPWNDSSGDRLRSWLALDKGAFYNQALIAIVPRGFCYPGKGRSGDLPPPAVCAETWHKLLLDRMPDIQLTLLVKHAQSYYLEDARSKSLTDLVMGFERYLDAGYFPLPHPSPRNTIWLSKNPWFTDTVVPVLKQRVQDILASTS